MKATLILAVALLMISSAWAQQPKSTTTPKSAPVASASETQTPSTSDVQTPSTPPAAEDSMLEARPDDVKSIDAIVAALYDTISGPAGTRNWKRLESLFIPEGRLIPNGVSPQGQWTKKVLTVEEYEKRAGDFFAKEGFYETGISNKIETYGYIAHVWSTYESRHDKNAQPFARGINSIQLASNGHRWYVVEILWQQETPALQIPQQYLKK